MTHSRKSPTSKKPTKLTIMKHKRLVITFLSVATFAVACKKEETASQQLDKVKTETKAAAREMKDYIMPTASKHSGKAL